MKRFRRLLQLILILPLLLATGCSDDQGAHVLDLNNSNIKKIRSFYELYMDEHGNRGPKDEAAFRDYIANGRKANRLKKLLNIDDSGIDAIFISERDNEPFKIKYGVKEPLNHAIVFEATGVDGKRLVARYPIEELEAAEYDGWLSGKTKPKPLPTLGEVMAETSAE